MTCLEKYLQEHPDENPDDVIRHNCPNCDGSIDIADPSYCTGDDSHLCRTCWNRQIPGTEEPLIRDSEYGTEAVNHPKHYVREGAMECIDEMLVVFGVKATQSFCLLNAWKYRYRAGAKGGEEDMKKSDWYLAKYAELRGGD